MGVAERFQAGTPGSVAPWFLWELRWSIAATFRVLLVRFLMPRPLHDPQPSQGKGRWHRGASPADFFTPTSVRTEVQAFLPGLAPNSTWAGITVRNWMMASKPSLGSGQTCPARALGRRTVSGRERIA